MNDLWYYTSEGKAMEPVPTAELKRLAQAGLLKPTDLVWQEGMPAWAPASKTRGLFGDTSSLQVIEGGAAASASEGSEPALLPSDQSHPRATRSDVPVRNYPRRSHYDGEYAERE